MTPKTITYWTTTIFVMLVMTVSGVLAATHAPAMMTALAHLGYPAYFANLLGVSKLLGVCVVLMPGRVLAKEWAYAGFGVLVSCAAYSHLLSGDGWNSLEPVVVLCLLAVSYQTRPASRRLAPPKALDTVRDTQ